MSKPHRSSASPRADASADPSPKGPCRCLAFPLLAAVLLSCATTPPASPPSATPSCAERDHDDCHDAQCMLLDEEKLVPRGPDGDAEIEFFWSCEPRTAASVEAKRREHARCLTIDGAWWAIGGEPAPESAPGQPRFFEASCFCKPPSKRALVTAGRIIWVRAPETSALHACRSQKALCEQQRGATWQPPVPSRRESLALARDACRDDPSAPRHYTRWSEARNQCERLHYSGPPQGRCQRPAR